jgi:hypothetical protein
MVDDLTYLSVKNNQSFLSGISIDELRGCATFEFGQNKLVGRLFCLSNLPSYQQANPLSSDLKNVWLSKIIEHPIDYLQFRMAAFSYLVRTPQDPPFYIWHSGIDENIYGFKQVPNALTIIVEKFVKKTEAMTPFFFKPYWWLLTALLLLAASYTFVKTKTVSLTRMLLISSIFYVIGYLPVTPMADFRYIYWSVVATTLSLVLLLIDWPGFSYQVLKKRAVLVLSFMLLCSILALNHGRITELNIDSLVSNSIRGERIAINNAPIISGLLKVDEEYLVDSVDPYLIYDLSTLKLHSREIAWLRFEFFCTGARATPELQFFWWGNRQAGALEEQSIRRRLTEGVNIIPVKYYNGFNAIRRLRGIRLDLSNSTACKSINIKNIEFIKDVIK